ncbi:MAG: M42 family metallopeptidase [Chitinophagales bacterium]|nr:M42 family metallopeptidase [Bacteroidota bacterium]MCB9042355.1 M42 family metallopeptidase [Chitinophagales bacterium]
MKIDFELLATTCKLAGTSGYEQRVREFVINTVSPFADKVYTDHIGNVIAVKKGKSDKHRLMLAAHMDEIGFLVTHIDKRGFLRFHTIGGFDPKTLTSQRVIVHGKKDILGVMGSKPIHVMTAEELGKKLETTHFFIDTGLPYEEVVKYISVGDTITRVGDLMPLGDCVNGKSLDNRIAVYVLLEYFREMKNQQPDYDVYAAFTVQEEVGLRGVQVATLHINPDFGINLDTTIAYDVADAKDEEMITRLGEGTAIKVMDSSVICDYRMLAFLKELAQKENIRWQAEVLPRGGTDTAGIQRFALDGGCITGALSIPTRHIHQTVETVHRDDVRATIELLKAATMHIAGYNWDFR